MSHTIERMTVGELQIILGLTALYDGFDDQRIINDDSVSRPILEMTGIFEYFNSTRVQVIGNQEMELLESLEPDVAEERISKLCSYTDIPAIIFSRSRQAPQYMIDRCRESGIPLFSSASITTMLIGNLSRILREYFAPQTNMHGVMLDVKGIGVIITGESSIGKSETALELVTRGNQLISDDRVIVYEVEPGMLIGKAPRVLERMMEIRGLGIVDIMTMYGAGSFRQKKSLSLVIQLVEWTKQIDYDRIGLQTQQMQILNTMVDRIILPVRPGRNTATLIESAALNQKLRRLGINSAEAFIERLSQSITQSETQEEGTGVDDE